MSDEQLKTLQRSYNFGYALGVGESMRAICWQESSGGVDLENEEDGSEGSYGHFGINPVIAATRVYKTWAEPPSKYQVTMMILALEDFNYGATMCQGELYHWMDEHGIGQWTKIWASYNAGNEWEKGKKYAQDIRDKITFLREVT